MVTWAVTGAVTSQVTVRESRDTSSLDSRARVGRLVRACGAQLGGNSSRREGGAGVVPSTGVEVPSELRPRLCTRVAQLVPHKLCLVAEVGGE